MQLSTMRGAALLLVLWLIAMLTALVGAFALSAQIERLQGRVLVDGVVAEQAARAGVEYAIARVTTNDPRRAWLPDGRSYHWQFHGVQLELRVIDEQGKVDLNLADASLLEALLRAVGSPPGQAAGLAAAIVDWRDPDPLTQPAGGAEDPQYAAAGLPYGAKDAPFESVAELQQVLGFEAALFTQLQPHVTVFSGRAQPNPAFASAPVLTAMGMNGAQVLAQRHAWDPASGQPASRLPGAGFVGRGSRTYSIHSRARLRDGRQAVLRVIVRTGGSVLPSQSYTPMSWETGLSPR